MFLTVDDRFNEIAVCVKLQFALSSFCALCCYLSLYCMVDFLSEAILRMHKTSCRRLSPLVPRRA